MFSESRYRTFMAPNSRPSPSAKSITRTTPARIARIERTEMWVIQPRKRQTTSEQADLRQEVHESDDHG